MNISDEDMALLEKLVDQEGARGALARVLLAIVKTSSPEADFEQLEE